MKSIFCSVLILLFHLSALSQSEVILFEDFNDCSLPQGWEVEIEGNQDVHWLVGLPDNPHAEGTSIDGSCMVVIDDDLTGNNTEGYIWRATSPEFSTRGFDKITFSIDFHLRYTWVDESFRIFLVDESNSHMLFESQRRNYTDTLFSGFQKISADLSFYPAGEYRIVLEYDDNSRWAWWAGFDNFSIIGDSRGVVLHTETFNDCTNPATWANIILSGDNEWQFGQSVNPNTSSVKSMNGTCFAFFDDDILGNEAAPSTVALVSAPIDLIDYATYTFSFDLAFRQYSSTEFFEIGILVDGERIPIETYTNTVGTAYLDEYETQTINLSPYKGENLQIYFLYHDGGGWGWWVGIDNVKLSGHGDINDLCSKAFVLNQGESMSFDITNAYRDLSIPSDCNPDLNKNLWYVYDHENGGIIDFSMTNNFDGVLEIFQGNSCQTLELVTCIDRDEYGFYGENKTLELENGRYFVRLSSSVSDYTTTNGQGEIVAATAESIPTIASNEDCERAQPINFSTDTPIYGFNLLNPTSEHSPSDNSRARSDVWFSFIAESEADLTIDLLSDFSGSFTIYEGNCSDLIEISTDHSTGTALLDKLTKDQNYYIQVSGIFSTLEGHFEIRATPALTDAENTDCLNAEVIILGDECHPFSNHTGGFSGIKSTCSALADADRWFSFNAPQSGSIELRFQSNFLYTISVLDMNDCDNAITIFCSDELHFCDGYSIVRNLTPDKKYYIQIASKGRVPGGNRGEGCLYLRETNLSDTFEPLSMVVETICASKDAALLMPTATGGAGDYQYYGANDLIASLQNFVVEVEDKDGCIYYFEGVAPDCSETACNVAFEIITYDVSCFGGSDGRAEIASIGGLAPYNLIALTGEEMPQFLAAGTYHSVVSDAAGCTDTITFSIEQPSPIEWALIEFYNNNQTGLISISGHGGTGELAVTWLKDGEIFAENVWEISISQIGEYMAIITDELGCTVETDIFDFTTSNHSYSAVASWNIYPNPVQDFLNLECKNGLTGLQLIEVINTLGVIVYSAEHYSADNNIIKIDGKHWVDGVYTLVIKDKKTGLTETMSIMKVSR